MTEITNIKVYDLKESVIASGNAMRIKPVEYTDDEFERGLARMKKLVHSSYTSDVHCHDNALTGIRVSFDIKYPQYLSTELQRYHWIDIVTSSSKMHRLCQMKLSECCNKYVAPEIIETVQKYIDIYNAEPNYENFMRMVSNTPTGLELFMRVSTNYKQLQTIYNQRRYHRLKEDWGAICDMIEQLPYFDILIKKS
jgi:hypothetical protein